MMARSRGGSSGSRSARAISPSTAAVNAVAVPGYQVPATAVRLTADIVVILDLVGARDPGLGIRLGTRTTLRSLQSFFDPRAPRPRIPITHLSVSSTFRDSSGHKDPWR